MISQKEFNELSNTQNGRIGIIDIGHGFYIDNFQMNKTPMSIIRKMCNKTSVFDKEILVLFNLEFLECLVFEYKVPVGNITFVSDNLLEKTICEKLYGVYSIVIGEVEFKVYGFREIEKMSKKFDLVFSNPPYNSNVDLKIINEIYPICNEMVVVHPSTWLIDLKGKKKMYNDFKSKIEGDLKSVEMFNGNPVFNINLEVPCVIIHIEKDYSGDIHVKHIEEEFYADSLCDITKFGKSWTIIIRPFFDKLEKYVSTNGSIWDKKVLDISCAKEKLYHCQIAAIIGGSTNDERKFANNKAYTMCMKNPEMNKGIRNKDVRKDGFLVWEFETENERDNFVSFLSTDFARFCLSLLKISQNCHYGEMSLVPWLDFTQEWDDEKLFKHFNIDQKTQDYIREFLPDFHGIRK